MYIGEGVSDLHLIYLPFHYVQKECMQQELQLLLKGIFNRVSKNSTDWIQLSEYVRDESFSIKGFKGIILSKLVKQEEVPLNEGPLFLERVEPKVKEQLTLKPVPKQEIKPQINKIIFGVAAAIAFITWSNYFSTGGEALFQLSTGLTLLVGDALFVWHRFFASRWSNSLKTDELVTSGFTQPIESHQSIEQYYEDLPNHTTLLSPPEETVYLKGAQDTGEKPKHAYFEVTRDAGNELIPILGNSFIVGRGPHDVHLIENRIGVSRQHFEVIVESGIYQIKDLRSKNGTMLNDEMLIPYKLYPLNEGDQVMCIRTQFLFTYK